MFYKINNKTIADVVHDFHFIVLYPPPITTKLGKMYPWQVWTNDNFEDYCLDFKLRITAFNLLKLEDSNPIIDWVFCTDWEYRQYIEKKFEKISPLKYKNFIVWAANRYREGWTYGIVDTYDNKNLKNTSIKNILKEKEYDFSIYSGCILKKLN